MATKKDIPELLRQGIEAAREGRKAEAQRFFEQVTELDENNEKGWFWLASVVETDEERRICLSNVLHINPNNERAQRALAALDSKPKAKKQQNDTESDEVVAGVSQKQLRLIIGAGSVAVALILVIGLVVIVGNNNRIAAENSAATAVAAAQTAERSAIETQQAVETQAALDIGATQTAMITPTIEITTTPIIATLPPTWTYTPSPTIEATLAALPAPLGLSGRLVVWSGRDELSTGYLRLGYYNLDFGNQYTQIGSALGNYISIADNGDRVLYERYDPLLFSRVIEASNLNGTEVVNIAELYIGESITIVEPQMPDFGPFGQSVTFVAKTLNRNSNQVFVVTLGEVPPGVSRVKQLTDDDVDYTFPAFSPDGSRIVAVRSDLNSANPSVDLVNIDVSSGGKFLVTNDLSATIETHPRWTRDSRQVVYAAASANAPDNHDIFIRSADGAGSALPIYRDPSDDTFPVLSPDGRYLAFSSNRNGKIDIYVYEQNTQALSQLTNTVEADYPGEWWQPGT